MISLKTPLRTLLGLGAGISLLAGVTSLGLEATAQSRTLPFPDNQVAYLPIRSRTVDIQLSNPTNAVISYQVLGDTDLRYLAAGKTIMLKNIPLNRPVTVAFHREDGGFLNPNLSLRPGMLKLDLKGTGVFSQDQNVMVIEPSGRIYIY